MPAMTVSPGNHVCSSLRLNALRFHSVEGSVPLRSPAMSMPVFSPSPNFDRKPCMRSMPISAETP